MGGGPDQEELLVTLPIPKPEANVAELQRRFPHVKVTWLHISDKSEKEDELKDLYRTTTILLTLFTLPDDASQVPNLKLIQLFSAGIDRLTTHPLYTSSEIPIATASGIHGPPIAEWVLSSLLSLTRHTFLLHDWQRRHEWASDPSLPDSRARQKLLNSGGDWAGKTVGIAGYGGIGRQVARVLVGLGVRVHVFTATAKTTEAERRDHGFIVGQDRGWELGDREGKLPVAWFSGESADADADADANADATSTKKKTGLHAFLRSGLGALVVALPLTPQTERLFGRREFELLRDGVKERPRSYQAGGVDHQDDDHVKAGAGAGAGAGADADAAGCYFVNISRGKIVDQSALVEALHDGTLKGAALDVTDPEPLPKDDPLWDAPNCIVTPHVSGLGREYTGRALEVLMENMRRRDAGEDLVNEVRRKRGY